MYDFMFNRFCEIVEKPDATQGRHNGVCEFYSSLCSCRGNSFLIR